MSWLLCYRCRRFNVNVFYNTKTASDTEMRSPSYELSVFVQNSVKMVKFDQFKSYAP